MKRKPKAILSLFLLCSCSGTPLPLFLFVSPHRLAHESVYVNTDGCSAAIVAELFAPQGTVSPEQEQRLLARDACAAGGLQLRQDGVNFYCYPSRHVSGLVRSSLVIEGRVLVFRAIGSQCNDAMDEWRAVVTGWNR